jgi:hypothetical protein
MKVKLEEMETVITMSRTEKNATVYSSDINMRKRLNRLYGDKLKRTFTQDGEVIAEEYEIDKRMISFRSKLAEPKPLTDEERERRREQMKRIRAQQMARKKG